MSSTNGVSLYRQHPDIIGKVTQKELGIINYRNVEINVYEDYRGRRWECWWLTGNNPWYTQKVSELSLEDMQKRVDEFFEKGFISLPWNSQGNDDEAQKILESHLGVKVKPEVFQSNGAIRFVVGS